MQRLLSRAAWLPSVLLSLFAWLLVDPLGDFPLNDDWQYARAARRFLDLGTLHIDTAAPATMVGQILGSWPSMKLFGFSHTVLRLTTIALSLALLVCVDWILRRARSPLWARISALCVLALNPYWFYLAGSYMTELWGLAPALLAAGVWFHFRRERGPIVPFGAALATGLLCGLAFWTRQFAVLALPALLLSALPALRGRWRESIPSLAVAVLACATAISLWLPFARATGNIHPVVLHQSASIFKPAFRQLAIQGCFFTFYMSGFFLPLLLLLPFPRSRRRYLWVPLLLGIAIASAVIARTTGETPAGVRSLTHTRFPYMGNILYDAGLGPLTEQDRFARDLPPPSPWGENVWRWIELAFGLACALWVSIRIRREGAEVALFGAGFGIISLLATAQTTSPWYFERYSIPGVVGLAIAFAALAPELHPSRVRWAAAGGAFALIAAFSVGAMHDQMRWQGARAALVQRTIASGVDPSIIEAGYELDGWLRTDGWLARKEPRGCIHGCACNASRYGWFCRDDSYFVALNLPKGYQVIDSIKPETWLVKMPPMRLGKRN